jgi:hypothetical protein
MAEVGSSRVYGRILLYAARLSILSSPIIAHALLCVQRNIDVGEACKHKEILSIMPTGSNKSCAGIWDDMFLSRIALRNQNFVLGQILEQDCFEKPKLCSGPKLSGWIQFLWTTKMLKRRAQ